MAQPLLGLRMHEQLLKQAEQVTEEHGFSSVQEFIREAIRARIETYERQKAIEGLKALAGTQTATPKPKEELAELAKRLYG